MIRGSARDIAAIPSNRDEFVSMTTPATHSVTNQTPPLTGYNAFQIDPLFMQLAAQSPAGMLEELDTIGKFVLSADAQDLARLANRNLPRHLSHDRQGNRIDHVEVHPALHALMRKSVSWGLSGSVWEDAARGAGDGHFQRACRLYLMAGLEAGHTLPLSATNASVAALMTAPDLARQWAPRIVTRKFDNTSKTASQKSGVLVGLALSEKQAGSEIRGITTRAEIVRDNKHRLTGHKWHVAAPASDALVMLARTQGGLSAFLVPRFTDDDKRNASQIIRLKEPLGFRSCAFGEIEMSGATGQMIGAEGEGMRAIAEITTLMRLDSSVIASAMMQAGLREAVHHARSRVVSGKALIDEPLMQRVIGDLLLDVSAARALSFRLARAFDAARSDDRAAAYAHVMTPAAGYWTAKLAPAVLGECIEMLGGNGYSDEAPVGRMLRDSHGLSFWPATGSRNAIELARISRQMPSLIDSVIDGISAELGEAGKRTVEVLRAAFGMLADSDASARLAIEQLAYAAAAAELVRLGMGALADAFASSRLSGQWRSSYGVMSVRADEKTLIDALYPPVR